MLRNYADLYWVDHKLSRNLNSKNFSILGSFERVEILEEAIAGQDKASNLQKGEKVEIVTNCEERTGKESG